MSIASNRKPKTLLRKTNTVVIGVGNAYGGDDAAGLVAAQRLAQLASDGAMILTETGDAARLIELWKGANKVIILDAVSSGVGPGTPRRLLKGLQARRAAARRGCLKPTETITEQRGTSSLNGTEAYAKGRAQKAFLCGSCYVPDDIPTFRQDRTNGADQERIRPGRVRDAESYKDSGPSGSRPAG